MVGLFHSRHGPMLVSPSYSKADRILNPFNYRTHDHISNLVYKQE